MNDNRQFARFANELWVCISDTTAHVRECTRTKRQVRNVLSHTSVAVVVHNSCRARRVSRDAARFGSTLRTCMGVRVRAGTVVRVCTYMLFCFRFVFGCLYEFAHVHACPRACCYVRVRMTGRF